MNSVFQRGDDVWYFATDSIGRRYAVKIGSGRVPLETAERARRNHSLRDF